MKSILAFATCALALVLAPSALAQTGSYTTYGTGCAGSGSTSSGVVLPKGYEQGFGNSNNRFPFGSPNMHYMQVHASSDLPPTALIRGINLRNRRGLAIPAYQLTMDIKVGYHTGSARSLNTTFASNWAVPPTTVFSGNYNVQAAPGTQDPKVWPLKIPFRTPFVYTRPRGNFLFEVVNTTTTVSPFTYFDAASSTTIQASRMWALTAAATTGSIGAGYAVTIQLEGPPQRSIVQLSNTGVPRVNGSYSVEVSGAAANLAAILWLGAQQLNIDLSAVLPGCSLYTSLDVLLGAVATNASGNGTLPFAIPNNRAFAGVRFYNQWMVVDPAANSLGVVLSNGGNALIGG